MSPASPVPLDIHRVSPVRGQLEPYDPRTPRGSRYIQCTETPEELKVLLPPGTAAMYEQLLKLETYEISKKPTLSWERIMEIRHLKDRMIRKCQKLSKTSMPMSKKSSRGDTFSFQTFVAPSDFRCKEMEKWFRDQQKRTGSSVPRRSITTNGHGAIEELTLSRHASTSSKQPIQRSITNPESSSKQRTTQIYKALPGILPTPTWTTMPLPVPAGLNEVMSPPPLPVLLLSVREELGFDDPPPPDPSTNPPNLDSLTLNDPDPSALPADPPAGEPSATPRPTLSRRPSAIKRMSTGELKTVSWADNHDIDSQLSKYAAAAREAQASGKWDEVRALYMDQIAGLENLHAQVSEGLDHLRSETDHLQRIDETIRRQREALDASFHDFEQKQTLFQEKVQEALTEANDTLIKHGAPPRELDPIHES